MVRLKLGFATNFNLIKNFIITAATITTTTTVIFKCLEWMWIIEKMIAVGASGDRGPC